MTQPSLSVAYDLSCDLLQKAQTHNKQKDKACVADTHCELSVTFPIATIKHPKEQQSGESVYFDSQFQDMVHDGRGPYREKCDADGTTTEAGHDEGCVQSTFFLFSRGPKPIEKYCSCSVGSAHLN